jgi:hypothetical protein
MYLDRFLKNVYNGQSDAVPKLARWVESDQSIYAAMMVSRYGSIAAVGSF